MQQIFFMRHGESEANAAHLVAGKSESPLNEKGAVQALAAAQQAHAQSMKFDIIISSPLSRSAQTARTIADELQYSADAIIYDQNIKERDCGDFEGRNIKHYYETPEPIAAKDHGVESIELLHDRASRFMDCLNTNYPDKVILVVSHSGFGKMLRIVAQKRPAVEFDKTSSIPNATIFRLV